MTHWRPRWADLALAVLLALLVLGSLLTPGFVLAGDMVFVPDQPWKDSWTGGDGGVPRAVPSDAWVALLDEVVPGALLQKLVLLSILVGAGLGMSRLLAHLPWVARAAGIVLYTWNPFVHERLAIGHWALLLGYAALPWVVHAALLVREGTGTRRGWGVLALGFAVAGWSSPTGGLCALLVALAVIGIGRWRRSLGATLLGAWVNLPWIVPAFLNGSDQLSPDPFGVSAFAARADSPWGLAGSVVSFGGIWKESVFPAARADPVLSGLFLLLVVGALVGLWIGRRDPLLPVGSAVIMSVPPLALALLSGFEATRGLVEWVVVHVPGGGLFRDAQKWLMPWVLVAATGLAGLLAQVQPRLARFGGHAGWWLGFVVALPVLTLPSMALGLGGFLETRDYPADWFEMRDRMQEAGVEGGRVVVLPFSTYRRFDWNTRTVLDPAPRFFPGRMVTDDALVVPSGTVGGESRLAREVRLSESPEELGEVLERAGVRWLLVHEVGEPVVLPSGARPVLTGDQLSLHELPGGEGAEAGHVTGPGDRAAWYAALDVVVLVGTVLVVGMSTHWATKLRGATY